MPPQSYVVFLDIDGVMLPTRAYELPENKAEVKAVGSISAIRPDRVRLHPEAISALSEIHRQIPEARLVLCTSWRHSVGVAETVACLERHGVAEDFWHADRGCPWTPPSASSAELGVTTGSSKADDIIAWLKTHAATVSKWLVLDDDPDLASALISAPAPGFVMRVDGTRGLTRDDVPAILGVLTLPAVCSSANTGPTGC